MSKHTPGPWHWRTGYTQGEPVSLEVEARRNSIATTPLEEFAVEEREANAALIAAAPDMLAALKALYQECAMIHIHWGDGNNQEAARAAIAAGKAAIAKAEGGAS